MYGLIFALLCGIWGTSFILMGKAALAFGPLTIGAIGTLGGATVLALIWWRQGLAARFRRAHFPALVVVVCIGFAWPFYVQPYLIGIIGHGYVGCMLCLVPIATIVVAIPILGQRPTRVQVLGVTGGLIFLLALFWDGLDRRASVAQLLLTASVPVSYAVSNSVIKRSFSDIPPVALACVGMGLASILLAPLAIRYESVAPVAPRTLVGATVALALLVIFSRGIATVLFFTLIHVRGPLFAGMVSYVIPVVVLLWSRLDGENVTPRQVMAVAGTLALVAVVQTDIARVARAGKTLQHGM